MFEYGGHDEYQADFQQAEDQEEERDGYERKLDGGRTAPVFTPCLELAAQSWRKNAKL